MLGSQGFPGATYNGTAWVPYCWSATITGGDNTNNAIYDCLTRTNTFSSLSPAYTSNAITYVMNCATNTFTFTPTYTFTFTFTFTNTYTPTPWPTGVATYTPTITPTPTNTPTITLSPTPNPSPSNTPTPSPTPSPSQTPTWTMTLSPTPSPTNPLSNLTLSKNIINTIPANIAGGTAVTVQIGVCNTGSVTAQSVTVTDVTNYPAGNPQFNGFCGDTSGCNILDNNPHTTSAGLSYMGLNGSNAPSTIVYSALPPSQCATFELHYQFMNPPAACSVFTDYGEIVGSNPITTNSISITQQCNTPTNTPSPTATPSPAFTSTWTQTYSPTPSSTAGSPCVPTSAQICVASDDFSQVYVGGVYLGQVAYCNFDGSGSCPPGCITVPTSLLAGSQVYVAVYTQNTACNNVYTSWDLDITCSNGQHSEITSGSGGIGMDYVSSGNPTTPPASNWYATNYSGTDFTSLPVSVSTTSGYCCWGQQIFNPVTGSQAPFISADSNGAYSTSNCNGALFFRQEATIQSLSPIAGPPSFTITNSLVSGSAVTSGMDMFATFGIKVCNNGGAVTQPGGVTITDNFPVSAGFNFSCWGFGPTTATGSCYYYGGGQPDVNANSIYWSSFGGGGNCVTLLADTENFYLPGNQCQTLVNNASLTWISGSNSGSVNSNSVSVPIPCFSPTVTYTPTYTFTSTYTPPLTFTPTITNSPTPWPTSVATFTSTPSPTSTSISPCTPSSAQICVASDDWSQVYVGGVYLGQINYCNWNGTGSCPPGCITVPTSLLSGNQVYVAVYTQNTSCNTLYASWDLDITCSNGEHSDISSATGGINMDYVNNGNPSTPPASNWYATNYNTTGWISPVVVSEASGDCCLSQSLYNPTTGGRVPFLSTDSTGAYSTSNCNGALFFSQASTIPPPIPVPPATNISLTKSFVGWSSNGTGNANSVTFPGYQQNESPADRIVSIGVQVCNSGRWVTNPVTFVDSGITNGTTFFWSEGFRSSVLGVTNKGFTGNPDSNGFYYDWDQSVTMLASQGFPGATYNGTGWTPYCWSTTIIGDDNTNNAMYDCLSRVNTFSLLSPASTSNAITYVMNCPTNTYTPTYTYTYTNTPTPWPTGVATYTRTNTPSPTSTPTNTISPTITLSSTPTTSLQTPTFTYTPISGSPCIPSSAKICVASDDWSQVYVGGVYLGQVAYCNWNGTGNCPPGCITVPTSLLTGSQVYVAVYTQNTACNTMYTSWDLDITCSNGQHSEITSSSNGVSMDYVSSGNPSTPPASNWYATNYTGTGGTWQTPAVVNTATGYCCWGQSIFNPVTGQQVPFTASTTDGDYSTSNCNGAFFETLAATIPAPQPTVGPVTMTITKSLAGTNISGGDMFVTYAVAICNTGGPVSTGGVTLTDTQGGGTPFSFLGWVVPAVSTTLIDYNANANWPEPAASGGSPATWGTFPGNTCVTLMASMEDYYWAGNACVTTTNTASVGYPGGAVTSNLPVTVNRPCVTITPTSTPTPTNTLASPTVTFTPTYTYTYTPVQSTPTPTQTPTLTPTWTITPTNTIPGGNPPPTNRPNLFPSLVRGSGPITLQFLFTNPINTVDIKIYSTAFRLISNQLFTQIPAGANTGLPVYLISKSGAPLANGLYHVLVTINGKRYILKLLILR